MAKISYELDVQAVLGRMSIALGAENITQLAEMLGLSQNALSQTKYRGSIALPLLLKCVEKAGSGSVTLDYLVYGDDRKKEAVGAGTEYVELESIDGGIGGRYWPILFHKQWLERLIARRDNDIAALKQLQYFKEIYIIDTLDHIIPDEGLIAFGELGIPAIRHCRREIGGKIFVKGEEELQFHHDLDKLIIGRVVWHGSTL